MKKFLYIATPAQPREGRSPPYRRFAVGLDGRALSGGKVFATCDPGLFDGFRLDVRGNIWTSAGMRPLLQPGRHSPRKINVPEVSPSLLRRPQAQPSVHRADDVALRDLRADPGCIAA